MRIPGPDGRIGHAELQLDDSVVMLADEFPEMGAKAPSAYGGSPVSLTVYVEDVDATFERATAAPPLSCCPLENRSTATIVTFSDDPRVTAGRSTPTSMTVYHRWGVVPREMGQGQRSTRP